MSDLLSKYCEKDYTHGLKCETDMGMQLLFKNGIQVRVIMDKDGSIEVLTNETCQTFPGNWGEDSLQSYITCIPALEANSGNSR